MDRWSLLPEEVAAKILLLLPWNSGATARPVCKRWRHILDTYEPETLVAGEILYPICYHSQLRTHVHWSAWDSARGSWREMPDFSFIPAPDTSCFWLASHRGLVLVSRGGDKRTLFDLRVMLGSRGDDMRTQDDVKVICNPLTQKFRVLPKLRNLSRRSPWELQVDPSGRSYTIRALAMDDEQTDGRFPLLVTYRSTTGAWSVVETGQPAGGTFLTTVGDRRAWNLRKRVVSVGEVVYAATDPALVLDSEGKVTSWPYLVALDVHTRVWSVVCRLERGFQTLLASGDGGVRVLMKEVVQKGPRRLSSVARKKGRAGFRMRFRIDRLQLDDDVAAAGASASGLVLESRSDDDVDIDGGGSAVSDLASGYEYLMCAPCGDLVYIHSRPRGILSCFRGVVYQISTREWHPWTVRHKCFRCEACQFEFGMRTEP